MFQIIVRPPGAAPLSTFETSLDAADAAWGVLLRANPTAHIEFWQREALLLSVGPCPNKSE